MRKKLAQLACLFVLIPAFAFFLKLKFLSDGDPDRYFHLALSRITYESGSLFLRSLPQVENLGWGELFLDKEFLFHQLTRIGFALGGDKGVVEASFLCSILSLVVFYLFASSRIPVLPAALVTAGVFSSPYLAFRLSLLRPHTLAVLAFILFQIAILSRRPRLTALARYLNSFRREPWEREPC